MDETDDNNRFFDLGKLYVGKKKIESFHHKSFYGFYGKTKEKVEISLIRWKNRN